MYDLDSSENQQVSVSPATVINKKSYKTVLFIILALLVGFGFGALSFGKTGSLAKMFSFSTPGAAISNNSVSGSNNSQPNYTPQTSQEDAVINVVKNYSPAVVSIIITKNVPVYEQYYSTPSNNFDPFGFWDNFQVPQVRQKGTQNQEVGAGSGFIVSEDGMVVTNKHVVSDTTAEYTAITTDGKKYPAKVLAIDPSQDLAVVKITPAAGQKFAAVKLGDSSNLQIGQSVIAIGNALGEFNNTVSVGVISGLQRSITAGGGGTGETLDNLIQTDAAINEGNSGGPLLNLKGEVIGVNTAMASGAQSIGFVLPVNTAKRDIDQVKNSGKITYAYLGVYYTLVDDEVQKANNLAVNYGAWVTTTSADQAAGKAAAVSVIAGSPAQKAGIKDQDIILEINSEKITPTISLSQLIAKYNPGDKVTLKVRRGASELKLEVTLADRSQSQ